MLICASVLRSLLPAAPPASPVAPALAPARGMIGRALYAAAFILFVNQCRDRRRQKNDRSNRQRRREDTANDPNS